MNDLQPMCMMFSIQLKLMMSPKESLLIFHSLPCNKIANFSLLLIEKMSMQKIISSSNFFFSNSNKTPNQKHKNHPQNTLQKHMKQLTSSCLPHTVTNMSTPLYDLIKSLAFVSFYINRKVRI